VNLPIRARMTVTYVVLTMLVLTGIGAFVVLSLRGDLERSIDRSLDLATRRIAVDYRKEGPSELADSSQTALGGERVVAQVLEPEGRVIVAYGDPVARAAMLGAGDRAATGAGRTLARTVMLGGQAFRLAARRVTRAGRPAVVVAGESLAPVERSVHRVLVLLLFACPAALLLIAAGGWLVAGRALGPVRRITRTAERIGVGDLGERVAVPPARDEVGALALTFNRMLDRIAQGVSEQHRLIADASHELRTPLAAMRAELDVSLRGDALSPAAREVLESAREEVDRMSRTVDDLLVLAAADEGRLDRLDEPLDLRALAGSVAEALAPIARRNGVDVTVDGPDAPVIGDHDGLRHALRNVVENAIKFTPAGGHVVITTYAGDGHSGVRVADDGPGIAPALRERVFDRFFRVDASRTRRTGGSGLGLAITRELVVSHAGRVWASAGPQAGSTFTIELPAAADQTETSSSSVGSS
jgi:heavy metal sensor kinase